MNQINKYRPSVFLINDNKILEKVKENLNNNIHLINDINKFNNLKNQILQ